MATLQLVSLTTNQPTFAEHSSITGFDRGGIAVSDSHLFYTGDVTTGVFALEDLAAGNDAGFRYDGIFSDVGSGVVYSLGTDAASPLSVGFEEVIVSHLLELDGATGALTGRTVELSEPVTLSNSSGIFAGNGQVVLYNRVTGTSSAVDTTTGAVTQVGNTPISIAFSSGWATWGVAEEFGGEIYLSYVSGNTILRTSVVDGDTSVVAEFAGDFGSWPSFTVSPQTQRWYFHYFGCSSAFDQCGFQTIGSAEAVIRTGLWVLDSTPSDGDLITEQPTSFVIDLSSDYDATTVSASDLSVNGRAADQVEFTDNDTLTFRYLVSPVTSQGEQTLRLEAGSISPTTDDPSLAEYQATFRYDAVRLAVSATNPAVGSIVPAPLTKLRLLWNEPIDVGSLTPPDITISQGSLVSVASVPGNPSAVDLTLSGVVQEGVLRVSFDAGAATDIYGNPSLAFQGSYTVDYTTAALPAPFLMQDPRGGLIYDANVSAKIGTIGDVDSFNFQVDSGQTVSIRVDGDASLRARAELFLVDGSRFTSLGRASASSPGATGLLQTVRIPGPLLGNGSTARNLQVRVSGLAGSVGDYDLQVVLNSALEAERFGGAANDARATAQDLTNSFISLNATAANGGGAERASVNGQLRSGLSEGDLFITRYRGLIDEPGQLVQLNSNAELIGSITLPLGSPWDVEQGYNDDLYVSTYLSSGVVRLLHFDSQGTLLDTIDAEGIVGQPNFLGGLGIDVAPDGTLWVTRIDSLFHLDPFGQTLASYPSLGNLTDVAVGADGQVYITDLGLGIRRLDPVTGEVTPFAERPGVALNVNTRANGEVIATGFFESEIYRFDSAGNPLPGIPTGLVTSDAQFNNLNEVWKRDSSNVAKVNLNGEVIASTDIGATGLTVIGSDGPLPSPAGRPDSGDFYSMNLKAGQTLSLVLATADDKEVQFELQDKHGVALAMSVAESSGEAAMNDFVVPSNGVYYVRVSGDLRAEYNLVATRNVTFETSDAVASNLVSGDQWVMGYATAGMLDYSTGFSNSSQLTTNGVATLADGVVSLTPSSAQIIAGSVFSNERFDIRQFQNSFTFRMVPGAFPVGEGITFTIQGNGSNEVGLDGAFLGYGSCCGFADRAITNSVAVKFDFIDNIGEGLNSTGLFTDGRQPTLPAPGSLDQSIDLSGTGIDFQSGHAFRVDMNYDGVQLRVSITDTVTGSTASQVYSVDIPLLVGGNQAFVGFTGSASSVNADQEILNWRFEPGRIGSDFYQVSLAERKTLELQTYLPGAKSGVPLNGLDPAVRVYDAAGKLVAFDNNGASDKRNAKLSYRVPRGAGGVYTIAVGASTATAEPTSGEYALSIKGEGSYLAPFTASLENPIEGGRVRGPISQLTVAFSDSLLLSTLRASDLKVNGVPAVGFHVIDGATITFDLPAMGEGTQTVQMAAGSVRDIQGTPLGALTTQFYHDVTPPRVVAISVQQNEIVPAGDLQITVQFSEPMRRKELEFFDFSLSLAESPGNFSFPESYQFDETGTRFTVQYRGLTEDRYRFQLVGSGDRFEDEVGFDLDGEATRWPIPGEISGDGVEGGTFEVLFETDANTIPWPAGFNLRPPTGSQILISDLSGLVNFEGDTDNYTLAVDGNQTVTLLLSLLNPGESSDPESTPEVQLVVSSGDQVLGSTRAAADAPGLINLLPISEPSTVTFSLSDAGAIGGKYAITVLLNAALELESYGGPANDTRATAQDLDAGFTPVGEIERAAVIGQLPGGGVLPDHFFLAGRFGQIDQMDSFGNLIQSFFVPDHQLFDLEQGTGDYLLVGAIDGAGQPQVLQLDYRGNIQSTIDLPAGSYGYIGLDVEADGSFWVTEADGQQLHHLDASGVLLSTISVADGRPFDVAVRSDGQLLVSRIEGNVLQIDPSTGSSSLFASMDAPTGLSFAPTGELLVASSIGGVSRFDSGGNLLQGSFGQSTTDVHADSQDNFWVTESGFLVWKFSRNGDVLDTVFGSSISGLTVIGTDGPSPSEAVQPTPDFYSLSLQAGDTLNVTIASFTFGIFQTQIQDAAGHVLADSSLSITGEVNVVEGWVAPQTGVYYVRVSAALGVDYTLLATRASAVELEAQPLSGALFALARPRVPGDINGDGRFSSSDLVAVFQSGEYEDDTRGNSIYEEGDWNGDGDFDSQDLIASFEYGVYEDTPSQESLHAQALDELFEEEEFWDERLALA